MKRLAIVIAIVAVLGIGIAGAANWYVQRTAAGQDAPVLAHVPAGTPFYFGYSEPLPATEVWREWQRRSATADQASFADVDPAALATEYGPAVGVFYALYLDLLEASAGDEEHPITRLGLARSSIMAVYGIGAQPVLRIALADREAFWAAVDRAEERAATGATEDGGDGVPLRRYAIEGGECAELVLAAAGGYAVAAVTMPGVTDDTLRLALGLELPESSLAESTRLADLAKRHGTLDWATGYVDHQIVVGGLTGDDSTRFGQMVAALRARRDSPGENLPDASPACRDDARALAAVWPRTVLGVSGFDTETGRVGVRATVAGTDRGLLDTLARLRGHIPESIGSGRLGGLGVGLNVSELVPVLQALATRLAAADWSCPALVDLQARANPNALGHLAIAAAFAGDLRGIGVAVDSVRFNGGDTPLVDGRLEIVTPRPQTLWQVMSSFLPAPPVQPPIPGQAPVALPAMPPVDVPLRVALRDNSVVILAGEASMADAAAGLDPNGLLGLRYHYAEVARAVTDWLEHSGDNLSPEQQQTLNAFSPESAPAISSRIRFDIHDTGLVLDVTATPGDQE